MNLTPVEREFLQRLSIEPWDSPPLFDHNLVARLVELGCVETEDLQTGSIHYDITAIGVRALAEAEEEQP